MPRDFLKSLKVLGFDDLWTDYLQPVQDYVRGLNDEEEMYETILQKHMVIQHPGEGDS